MVENSAINVRENNLGMTTKKSRKYIGEIWILLTFIGATSMATAQGSYSITKNGITLTTNIYVFKLDHKVGTSKRYLWTLEAGLSRSDNKPLSCDYIQLHSHMWGTKVYHPGPAPYMGKGKCYL